MFKLYLLLPSQQRSLKERCLTSKTQRTFQGSLAESLRTKTNSPLQVALALSSLSVRILFIQSNGVRVIFSIGLKSPPLVRFSSQKESDGRAARTLVEKVNVLLALLRSAENVHMSRKGDVRPAVRCKISRDLLFSSNALAEGRDRLELVQSGQGLEEVLNQVEDGKVGDGGAVSHEVVSCEELAEELQVLVNNSCSFRAIPALLHSLCQRRKAKRRANLRTSR